MICILLHWSFFLLVLFLNWTMYILSFFHFLYLQGLSITKMIGFRVHSYQKRLLTAFVTLPQQFGKTDFIQCNDFLDCSWRVCFLSNIAIKSYKRKSFIFAVLMSIYGNEDILPVMPSSYVYILTLFLRLLLCNLAQSMICSAGKRTDSHSVVNKVFSVTLNPIWSNPNIFWVFTI